MQFGQPSRLETAGKAPGQASDSLFATYERKAKVADNTRVQDLNNRCIVGMQEILHDGPDAYYKKSGAEAIAAAPAATAKLTTLREGLSGQAANQAQRDKLGAILDVHVADAAAGVARHADAQQEVYGRGVAAAAVDTARQAALADPSVIVNAAARAQGATRELYRGQPPEVVDRHVQEAGASLFAAVIRDRLSRNDPLGLTLFGQYGDRITAQDHGALGATAKMMADNSAAAEWVRTRNAGFAAAPTGDAAVDAVNVASASDTDLPPPVTSSGGMLNQDGMVGYGQRLAEIKDRRRALTALNEQEFAGDPARLQANRRAIDSDAAWKRAAVKAEADEVYTGLDSHMRTGGPGGGPAVTLPPPTIMSRLTGEQQKSVAAQVDRAIEGKKTRTDQATWYTIRQGLSGEDADERERWAHTNLIQFRGELSDEDFAALTKRQATVRDNDGGAEATRQQAITRMADRALIAAGIDPTPTQDRAPDSHTVQAATFRRALDDELSTFESSKGRPATAAEAQDIVKRLATAALKGGWLNIGTQRTSVSEADMPTEEQQTTSPKHADDAWVAQDETTERAFVAEGLDAAAVLTPEEIAQMRRALADGTAEQRAAVMERFEALPEDMKDAAAKQLVSQTAEPSVMSDAADEGLQDGERYAQVATSRGGGRGRFIGPLTHLEELDLLFYNLKLNTIRRLEPENRFFTLEPPGSPISPGQMRAVDEELAQVKARAARRDAADAALGGNGIAKAEKDDDEWDRKSRERKKSPREEAQKRPPQAEDLERRPDRPPIKPPHERSDEDIAEIARKIASGHAKAKHRKEFPELGSDVEFELHIADVIKNNTENKTTPDDHTAYWHKDSGTTVVFDPLAPDNGTVVRSEHGRRFFDNIPTKY